MKLGPKKSCCITYVYALLCLSWYLLCSGGGQHTLPQITRCRSFHHHRYPGLLCWGSILKYFEPPRHIAPFTTFQPNGRQPETHSCVNIAQAQT